MVVQHNLQAMNANRMLGVTTDSQSKATEKLSSGYRINRAADDAAGLTISEKMRKQMRGLDQASTNAQDGVSAVQTAEGALTEVHDMLQRMNELAVQASNGTNSESDRQAIQDEIDQLTTEIDRVSETTKFNEIYLLKGNVEGKTSDVKVAAHDAGINGKLVDNGNGTYSFELESELKTGDKIKIGGTEYTIGDSAKISDYISATAATKIADKNLSVGDSKTVNGVKTEITASVTRGNADFKNTASWTLGDRFIDDKGNEWRIVNNTDSTVSNTSKFEINLNSKNWKDDLTKALKTATEITHNQELKVGIGATQVAYSVKVLDELEENTASIIDVNRNTKATKAFMADVKAGDSISVQGNKYSVTENDPTSFQDIKDAIMAKGVTQVTIGDETYNLSPRTYTDEKTDSKYATAQDIIDMIEEGDSIIIRSTMAKAAVTMTAIGVSATDGDGKHMITANEAYRKITDELAVASSIGTDKGEEATARHLGDGKYLINQGSVKVKDALSFNLHVGADADMTNKIMVDVDAMSAAGLGIKGLNVKDETGTAATYAIDAIADAVAKVSAQRSALGAVQNRLEHTIKNLDNVVENTTSAESRIRDTDMAEEMVEFSKNNILAQAGQSMLAQANQSTQGVLSLLG